MSEEISEGATATSADGHRRRLLDGIPVRERHMNLADIPTTVLLGGQGPPIILLHGPGESAVNWRWVIPDLVTTHRVIAPDLPAHGSSGGEGEQLDEARVIRWLDQLIERTCERRPVLVGQVLGGAIGARFAVDRGDRLRHLVLVDSLGLAPFRPSLRFLLTMIGFQVHPSEGTYRRFMRHCAYDLDSLRDRMEDRWRSFVVYNLALARSEKSKAGGRLFRKLGLPRIPPDELASIAVPTSLIWGREDRALKLPIAEDASERYGWPLQVIDGAADDPPRDRPEAFVAALRRTLDAVEVGGREALRREA